MKNVMLTNGLHICALS